MIGRWDEIRTHNVSSSTILSRVCLAQLHHPSIWLRLFIALHLLLLLVICTPTYGLLTRFNETDVTHFVASQPFNIKIISKFLKKINF